MSSLSTKSDSEISKLLDEYGIKHGPVIDSTRYLYERKLNEAMSEAKWAKPTSVKTIYREEEEDEVTYVYRSPVRAEETNRIHSGAYMSSRPRWINHKEESTVKTAPSLSTMSDGQISKLLDEYGIKHGPVVDSTRRLYERKLNEAMSVGKWVKPPSDQFYYREEDEEEEEEEEVTYFYNSPVRGQKTTYSGAYMKSRPHWTSHKEEMTVKKTMSSLSTMSDGQISKLLDEFRIKHGPVLGTTRSLYERKLNEAMSKAK